MFAEGEFELVLAPVTLAGRGVGVYDGDGHFHRREEVVASSWVFTLDQSNGGRFSVRRSDSGLDPRRNRATSQNRPEGAILDRVSPPPCHARGRGFEPVGSAYSSSIPFAFATDRSALATACAVFLASLAASRTASFTSA